MVKKSSKPKKKIKKKQQWQLYIFLPLISGIFFIITLLALHIKQTPPTCANSHSCDSDLSMKIENNIPGMFQGQKIMPPEITTMANTSGTSVLGDSTISGEKHIYVDLATQTLYAYQGTTQLLKTFISSGKWGKTPIGNFHIWEKLRATRMAGGEGADAYDLPNVPYVMYFYHDFGLHGAYWHDNFGYPMSHGCVNMRSVDAEIVYNWADAPSGNTPGTEVSICNEITSNNQCIQNNPVQ